MTLGAGALDVLNLVLKGSMSWVLAGIGLGVLGSLGPHAPSDEFALWCPSGGSVGARYSVRAADNYGGNCDLFAGPARGESRSHGRAAMRMKESESGDRVVE